MRKVFIIKTFSIFLFFFCIFQSSALEILDLTSSLSDAFSGTISDHEGATTFRSLSIPSGGRAESLGSAFTGLCDDINFFEFNPAASCVLKNTEIAAFHNSWIADSNLETVSFTTRFNNFGMGYQLKCFYVPFTEYNSFGDKVASSYYSESTATANFSYNFLSGYKFKGIALGFNVKGSYRSMPDYTDNKTNEIIENSGLQQSAVAVLADFGALLRFNFLKFYTDREPNLRIGLAITNIGFALTGFASAKGIELDDSPNTKIAAGLSYRPFAPIVVSLDVKKDINLYKLNQSGSWTFCMGLGINITNFFELLAGFGISGGNPRFSIGGQFNINRFTVNVNYSLDLTTTMHPINRVSLSLKLHFGDRGRNLKQSKVEEFYRQGIKYYAEGKYDMAIEMWNESLKLNSRFDPAKDAISATKTTQDLYSQLIKFQNLDN